MTAEVRLLDLTQIWQEFRPATKGKSAQPTMNKFLYNKYSSSQNYYYTLDINNILHDNPAASTFIAVDIASFDQVASTH